MTDKSSALEPILSFLHQYIPFSQMLPVHQEYLAMCLEQVFYAENDIILNSQDGAFNSFYIIKQGCVSGRMNAGEPVKLSGPGYCFPVSSLLQKHRFFFQYRAVKSTICYKLKQSHFEYLMQQSDVFHDFCRSKLTLS